MHRQPKQRAGILCSNNTCIMWFSCRMFTIRSTFSMREESSCFCQHICQLIQKASCHVYQFIVRLLQCICDSTTVLPCKTQERRARFQMRVLTCRRKGYHTVHGPRRPRNRHVEIKFLSNARPRYAAAMVICLPFIDFHCTNAAPTIDTVPQATET
jgi:hypothetical protein